MPVGAAASDSNPAEAERVETSEKVRADFEVSFPVDI
jgi:hypothetical protein